MTSTTTVTISITTSSTITISIASTITITITETLTVDGSEILHQLRLVVYSQYLQGFFHISQVVVWDFSQIPELLHKPEGVATETCPAVQVTRSKVMLLPRVLG